MRGKVLGEGMSARGFFGMPWRFTLKREGFFENAFTLYFKT